MAHVASQVLFSRKMTVLHLLDNILYFVDNISYILPIFCVLWYKSHATVFTPGLPFTTVRPSETSETDQVKRVSPMFRSETN